MIIMHLPVIVNSMIFHLKTIEKHYLNISPSTKLYDTGISTNYKDLD